MRKETKNANVVFIDDLSNITQQQLLEFWKMLKEMKEGSEKEKELLKDISISEEIQNSSFYIKIDNKLILNIHGVTLSITGTEKQKISRSSINEAKDMIGKYLDNKTLLVIDLALDFPDGKDPEIGPLLWQKISEIYTEKLDVLFTSGNVNVWQYRNEEEEAWFAYRATIGNQMNPGFAATAANRYYAKIFENVSETDPLFLLLQYLLRSKYINKQYFGVVLLKAYLMMNEK